MVGEALFRPLTLCVIIVQGAVCGCHFPAKPPRFAEVPELTEKATTVPDNSWAVVVTGFKPDAKREDIVEAIRMNMGNATLNFPSEKMLSIARELADRILSGKKVIITLPPDLGNSMTLALLAAGLTVTVQNSVATDVKVRTNEPVYQLLQPGTFQPFPESDDRFYYVSGEVRKPGPEPYLGQTTLLNAIESAEGFTSSADPKRVDVQDSDGFVKRFNCDRILKMGTNCPWIWPGDKVEVKRRRFLW